MSYLIALFVFVGNFAFFQDHTAFAMSQELKVYHLHVAKGTSQLQIGEEWSRTRLNDQSTTNYHLDRLIRATAKVKTPETVGSAVYLGKFDGQHLMMTNHHVLSDCRNRNISVEFEALKIKTRCLRVIDKFSTLEATFFTINVSHRYEQFFEKLAIEVDFSGDIEPGEKLITAGHGSHLNTNNYLTYDESKTCVVATPTNAPRFVSVGQKYLAWAFIHACEMSPGDSGSVVVSERTGKIVGLNWATSTAKDSALLNSHTVFDWIEKDDTRLWGNLSLAVPTKLIMNQIFTSKNKTLVSMIDRNRGPIFNHVAKQ